MCGILGLVTFAGRHSSEGQFHNALMQLEQRGPDDHGTFHQLSDSRFQLSLGQTRLSILDLSEAGHQPMINSLTDTVCVYNGEIYNFKEIRDRLREVGYQFHSECDTEVVSVSYDEYQAEFLQKFVGMFALCLFDQKRRRLLLARDRLGIKPLYYYWDGQRFAFSSEIAALVALPALELEICQTAVHHLLRYGYIPGEMSIYKNVHKLRPGHRMMLDLDRPDIRKEQYWSALDYYRNPDSYRTEGEVIESLTDEIGKAVSRRLISDVPIGAFLSGGIDSSLVVALMQEASSRPVQTFTIGFSEPDFDEAPAAREIARYLGTDHTELYIDEVTVQEIAKTTAQHFDEPFADSSAVPTLALSRMTRDHVTVALSGDGGDELFWGYNNYLPAGYRQYEKLRSVPLPIRRMLGAILKAVPSASMRSKGFQIQFRDFVEYYLKNHRIKLQAHYPNLHAVARDGEDVLDSMCRKTVEQLDGKPRDILMGAMDLHAYLPDDILTKVDRASMSVGLEARVPILDHNVVQLAAGIPVEFKTKDGQLKYLLRNVLSKYVPQDLWDRPKKGFGIPISRWLRTSLKSWAEDELFAGDSRLLEWIDKKELSRVFDDHQAGKADNKLLIWACIQLAGWDRRVRAIGSNANSVR